MRAPTFTDSSDSLKLYVTAMVFLKGFVLEAELKS